MSRKQYKVKKGVVMPPPAKRRYPYSTMEIGDCFYAKLGDRNNALCAARAYRYKHNANFRVKTRNVETSKGMRLGIWRVS